LKPCVVGLGNIGLQLLLDLRKKEIDAVGVDRKPELVGPLRCAGLKVSTAHQDFDDIDVWLIAISTGSRMENLYELAETIRPKPGALVSVESTLIPGTMKRLAEIFETQNYRLGQDLFLIHVPHRINFGIDHDVFEQPRVIGGITPACIQRGLEFYQPLIKQLIAVSDVRTAELAKIIENSSRHLNIAFAEAVYRYCLQEGLEFDEVRTAVNSKTNVRLLDVDYGIGGECLSKDMRFLWEATGSELMESSLAEDERYRQFLFETLKNESAVLISGITYKPELKNLNFSRASELYQQLVDYGTPVYVEDPMFDKEELETLGFSVWNDEPVSVIIKRGNIFRNTGKVEHERSGCFL
jgi:nucleotide sugar dehydrogenase